MRSEKKIATAPYNEPACALAKRNTNYELYILCSVLLRDVQQRFAFNKRTRRNTMMIFHRTSNSEKLYDYGIQLMIIVDLCMCIYMCAKRANGWESVN